MPSCQCVKLFCVQLLLCQTVQCSAACGPHPSVSSCHWNTHFRVQLLERHIVLIFGSQCGSSSSVQLLVSHTILSSYLWATPSPAADGPHSPVSRWVWASPASFQLPVGLTVQTIAAHGPQRSVSSCLWTTSPSLQLLWIKPPSHQLHAGQTIQCLATLCFTPASLKLPLDNTT